MITTHCSTVKRNLLKGTYVTSQLPETVECSLNAECYITIDSVAT